MNFLSGISIFNVLIDFILPPSCPVSGELVEKQGMVSPEVWKKLLFISDPICDCCGRPFDFEQEKGALCGECLDKHPPFNRCRSALVYGEVSSSLIIKFKHSDQTHVVSSFMPWVVRAGGDLIKEADFIVPVPLHRWRLLSRRYNQAAIIAGELSKATGVSWLPDSLRRVRHTVSQGFMDKKHREENVKKAFVVREKDIPLIKGKRVLLVDDVYTTGATVKECAKALLANGCAGVDVLTVARVVR